MQRYNPKQIETKWQEFWAEQDIYQAKDFDERPKFVMLTEFPYPSGAGLHLGHAREYTYGDMISRFKRMQGYNVLYPMGFDAFGLPTENFAIKNKVSPQKATADNVASYKDQLQRLGYGFDWSRSFNTSDPDYYKWTQWLFLKFFEAGLAYQDEIAINWCPFEKTGLANEEVVNGRHERCGTIVEKKLLKQWLMRITDYADRLIEGLQNVDYPSRIADQQINWIGRSVGAEISFGLTPSTKYDKVVFASNNKGKRARMELLLADAGLDVTLLTPEEAGITDYSVIEDGGTLAANAEKKAQAIADLVDLPVLADDTGFYIADELIDPVTVKRNALEGQDEATLTIEEIADKMHAYYQQIAHNHGGTVDAQWRSALCLIRPDKSVERYEAVREVVLTQESHGEMDPYMPLRPLYMSKATGKYVLEQTDNEEVQELRPITNGLLHLLGARVNVFTTRPDTIYGATFLVLAPEHPLVSQLTTDAQRGDVETYVKAAAAKSDIERQDTDREKTGVFTGAYAANPATGEPTPVWVADYVLTGYGTGAIMAVPAHDERDYEFAAKFGIAIKPVVAPIFRNYSQTATDRPTIIVVAKDAQTGNYCVLNWSTGSTMKSHRIQFPGGGVNENESLEDAAQREFIEETGYSDVVIDKILPVATATYYDSWSGEPSDKRAVRYVALASVNSLQYTGVTGTEDYEKDAYNVEWLAADQLQSQLKDEWSKIAEFAVGGTPLFAEKEGVLIDSGPYTNLQTHIARERIVADLAAAGQATEKVNYRLRDWVFSRQHYWGEPIPIIHCLQHGAVAVPEDQLPVELPTVEAYEPTDTGESPLAAITDWVNTTCPTCGQPAKRETDTMPNWAGSSWYYLRYFDAHNDQTFAATDKLEYWQNVDLYLGGMEHTTLHLLYSRFWHQFLYDQGLVPTPEPYAARRGQGIILAADGTKMSKSKGNVVNPSEIIDSGYGADALRLSIAFLAPYDQTTPWSPESVAGTYRYVNRLWNLTLEYTATTGTNNASPQTDVLHVAHKTIKRVTENLVQLGFNTAIAGLMEALNDLYKLKDAQGFTDSAAWKFAIESMLQLSAPFIPHVTEELWSQLGFQDSIHLSVWPGHDEQYLVQSELTLAVQVNGKLRGEITVSATADEASIIAAARRNDKVAAHLVDKDIKKTIVVPGKLINFVAP